MLDKWIVFKGMFVEYQEQIEESLLNIKYITKYKNNSMFDPLNVSASVRQITSQTLVTQTAWR